MELCVRTPREATRVHAMRAGQAKTVMKTSMNVNSNNLVPMVDSVQTLKGRLNVRAPLDGQGSTAPTMLTNVSILHVGRVFLVSM